MDEQIVACEKMRAEHAILDLLLNWANADDNVHAVVMNGSRMNPNAPKDPFQDFDVVYLVHDVEAFKRSTFTISETYPETRRQCSNVISGSEVLATDSHRLSQIDRRRCQESVTICGRTRQRTHSSAYPELTLYEHMRRSSSYNHLTTRYPYGLSAIYLIDDHQYL